MTKAVTLESLQESIDDISGSIKDLAQFTGDGFGRLEGYIDKLDSRVDKLDGRMDNFEKHAESVDATLHDYTARFEQIDITLRDHTMRFAQIQLSLDEIIAKQDAHHNDIVEIYAILQKHEKHQKISSAELKDTELRLRRLIAWAQSASKVLNIPIKL